MSFAAWGLAASAAWTCMHVLLMSAMNAAVPEAYMDEPFHVGQTQAYCRGDWLSWDPKITTPPTLYAISTAVAYARHLLFTGRFAEGRVECDLEFLRAINYVFSLGVLVLVAHLVSVFQSDEQLQIDEDRKTDEHITDVQLQTNTHRQKDAQLQTDKKLQTDELQQKNRHISIPKHEQDSKKRSSMNSCWKPWLHAMVLCASPTHLLYAFLFYTDVGSLFFVLLAYVCSLPAQPSHGAASHNSDTSPAWPLLGGIACTASVIFRQTNVVWICFIAGTIVLRRIKAQEPNSNTNLVHVLGSVMSDLQWILYRCGSHIGFVLMFIAFAIHNEGVVLGDKSNHQVSLHGALVLYFAVFAAVMTGGIFGTLRALIPGTITHFVVQIILNILVAGIVHFLSYTHPFLLADNRHYTFYIWSKFFLRNPMFKYIPVPIYTAAITSTAKRLAVSRSGLWSLMYAVCTVAVLVPTPLVELRYFTVPLFVLGVHVRMSTNMLVLTGVAHVVVNAVTMYVFMFRTFEAPDGSVGRFMW